MFCFHFIYVVHSVDTGGKLNVHKTFIRRPGFIKMLFTTHAGFCFYVMEFKKQKNMFYTSEVSLCFTQKYNFCIMNKLKLI